MMQTETDDGGARDPLGDIATSPTLYPLRFGSLLDRLLLVRMTEALYRTTSFLDSRFTPPDGRSRMVPLAALASALAGGGANRRPVHFIFHIGHAGSTLISRLLDETGQVLSLREPLPLWSLAEAQDVLSRPESLISPAQFAGCVGLLLRLWSRGYPATRAVVVKATSSAARVGARLMAAQPGARGLYLHLGAESYLATMLRARTADMKLFAPERVRRLESFIGVPPPPLHAMSPGEVAALGWLAERLTEHRLLAAMGGRILPIDFEAYLGRQEETMARILGHFQLDPGPAYLAGLARSPMLTRYSKDPAQGYSAELRAQAMRESRRANAAEIRKGLEWLGRLGRQHPAVAAVLGSPLPPLRDTSAQ
jgi:hypothetical protein